MRNLIFSLTLLLFVIACSSDSSSEEPTPEQTNYVYKKSEHYYQDELISSQQVYYNDNKKVDKIITNVDYGWKISTISVTYEGDEITRIKKSVDYSGSDLNDISKEFNVEIRDNQIEMIETEGADYSILINFTNNYVDLYRVFRPSNNEILQEEKFQRNGENNILSHTIPNLKFTYSNYDIGNNLPFFREYGRDEFIVFGLKTSHKLPLTESVEQASGGSSESTLDPGNFTYDEENNIIKVQISSDMYSNNIYEEI